MNSRIQYSRPASDTCYFFCTLFSDNLSFGFSLSPSVCCSLLIVLQETETAATGEAVKNNHYALHSVIHKCSLHFISRLTACCCALNVCLLLWSLPVQSKCWSKSTNFDLLCSAAARKDLCSSSSAVDLSQRAPASELGTVPAAWMKSVWPEEAVAAKWTALGFHL